MKELLIVSMIVVSALGAGAAETWYLNADGSNNSGLNGATWLSATDKTTTSSQIVPGDNYIVGSSEGGAGDDIYVSSSDTSKNEFVGNSLQIGDAAGNKLGYLRQYGACSSSAADGSFGKGGLILSRGQWVCHYSPKDPYQVFGPVTVAATAQKPFEIFNDNNNATVGHGIALNGPLHGSGSLLVKSHKTAGYGLNFTLSILGGCSEFSGSVTTEATVDADGRVKRTGLIVTNATTEGSFAVGTHCDITPSAVGDVFTCRSLTFADGSTVRIKAADAGTGAERTVSCSKYVATEAFSAGTGINLEIDFADSSAGRNADVLELISVPKEAELSESSFTYVPDMVHEGATLAVRIGEDSKTLVLVCVAAKETLSQAEQGTNDKGMEGVKWSDGSVGTVADYNYMCAGYNIYVSTTHQELNVFHGNALQIGDAANTKKGNFYHYDHSLLSMPNDGMILDCGFWYLRYLYDYVVDGRIKIRVPSGSPFTVCSLCGSGNPGSSSLIWNGPISGSGSLKVTAGQSVGNVCTNFCLKIAGSAAEFSGSVILASQQNTDGVLCQAGLSLTNGVMPAAVSVGSGSYLVAPLSGERVSLSALNLSDGAEINMRATVVGADASGVAKSGTIDVTSTYSAAGKTHLKLVIAQVPKGWKGAIPLISVPQTSSLDEADFNLELSGDVRKLAKAELTVLEDPVAKTKTLAIEIDRPINGLLLMVR